MNEECGAFFLIVWMNGHNSWWLMAIWVLWIPLKFSRRCLVIYLDLLLLSSFFFLFSFLFFFLFFFYSSFSTSTKLHSFFEPWLPAPFLHSRRPLAIACLPFIPIILKSSSTSSFQVVRGLPLFIVPSTEVVTICFVLCWH